MATRGLAAAVLAVLLAGIVAAMTHQPEMESAGANTPSPVKHQLTGLIWINRPAPPGSGLPSGGVALSVRWADIEPTPGADVEAAVAQAVAAIPGRTPLKLRILAGIHAPDWVKQLAGGAVTLRDSQQGVTATVPRFWTSEVGDAYARLQERLARRFDDASRIREVAISRCTTFNAEPMIRQATARENADALLAAGYTVDADLRCQEEALRAHRPWRRTRAGLAVNPYQRVEPQGQTPPDTATPLRLMRRCRDVLGERCVLQNNSIRWPVLTGPYATLYESMAALGGPVAFQTAGPRRVGDWVRAIEWAVEQGATAVEVEAAQVRANATDAIRLHEALGGNR
jgi:hypothetical protein